MPKLAEKQAGSCTAIAAHTVTASAGLHQSCCYCFHVDSQKSKKGGRQQKGGWWHAGLAKVTTASLCAPTRCRDMACCAHMCSRERAAAAACCAGVLSGRERGREGGEQGGRERGRGYRGTTGASDCKGCCMALCGPVLRHQPTSGIQGSSQGLHMAIPAFLLIGWGHTCLTLLLGAVERIARLRPAKLACQREKQHGTIPDRSVSPAHQIRC